MASPLDDVGQDANADATSNVQESRKSPLEQFEASLKEAVRGKRLSQSRMEKTTAIAMKCMEHDAKLVSIMYRTHKHIHPTCKISSLYAFDALARAARSRANKHKQSPTSNQGNCATFLAKLEAVLDSLVKDMLKSGHEEAKEKTKKVLDIWSKSKTFPEAVITRLSKRVDGADQEPDVLALGSPPPQSEATPPSATPATPSDPQATLIALLSQAAQVVGNDGNKAINATNAPASDLSALQASLLQQITAQASAAGVIPGMPSISTGGPVPSSFTPPIPVPGTHSINGIGFGPPNPNSYMPYGSLSMHQAPGLQQPVIPWTGQPAPPNDPYGGLGNRVPVPGAGVTYAQNGTSSTFGLGNTNTSSYISHDPRRGAPPPLDHSARENAGRNDSRDPRSAGRGDQWNGGANSAGGSHGEYAGRPFDGPIDNSRGRGTSRGGHRGRGRGTWESRDGFDPRSRHRSRSKSPPGATYSTQTQRLDKQAHLSPTVVNGVPLPTSNNTAGKDEFGRDIRLGSPDGEVPVRSQPSAALTTTSDHAVLPVVVPEVDQRNSERPEPTVPGGNATLSGVGGLGAFDLSTFDFTSAAAWMSLAQAWKVTHGVDPLQEQLMQFIASGGQASTDAVAFNGTASGTQNGTFEHGNQWSNNTQPTLQQIGVYGDGLQQGGTGGWDRGHEISGGFRGRGRGRGRGNFRDRSYNSDTGGRAVDESEFVVGVQSDPVPSYDNMPHDENSSGGRMQRVGDGWMFTREG